MTQSRAAEALEALKIVGSPRNEEGEIYGLSHWISQYGQTVVTALQFYERRGELEKVVELLKNTHSYLSGWHGSEKEKPSLLIQEALATLNSILEPQRKEPGDELGKR